MRAELWSQAVLSAPAALLASWVCLVYRYHDLGYRVFGSVRSGAWAVGIIGVVTLAASLLGALVPQAIAAVPPVSLAVFFPFLLCGRRLRPEQPIERGVWLDIATVGLRLLLARLELRMCIDRDRWCRDRLHRDWSTEQLEDAALHLYTVLVQRTRDEERRQRLRSDFDAIYQSLDRIAGSADQRVRRRARHEAEQAFLAMLTKAYDWSHLDLRPSPASLGGTITLARPWRTGRGGRLAGRPRSRQPSRTDQDTTGAGS